jgi:hypothetical protein
LDKETIPTTTPAIPTDPTTPQPTALKHPANKLMLLAAFALALTSCCKKNECRSDNLQLRLNLIGFDSVDLALVVISSFKQGSNLSSLESREEIPLAKYTEPPYGRPLQWDSAHESIFWPAITSLSNHYDYLIELVPSGKKYAIKDFVQSDGNISKYCGGNASDACYEVVMSYNLDGTVYSTHKSQPDYGSARTTDLRIVK